MADYSYVFNAHPSFIESLYSKFKADPDSVEEGWKTFFHGYEFNGEGIKGSNGTKGAVATVPSSISNTHVEKEFGVLSIIHGFRSRGHLLSDTNPIRTRKDRKPHLSLADYHLDESDLSKVFEAGHEIGIGKVTLQEILNRLNDIYTGHIGFEIAHIENREKRMWLREKIEQSAFRKDFNLDIDKKKRILEKLNGAVIFEKFLHTKYVGQKRFSLEGGRICDCRIRCHYK